MQNLELHDSSTRSTSQPKLILKRKLYKWHNNPSVLPP